MSYKEGPVETVKSVSVLGSTIMLGTWPDGDTELHIWSADPISPSSAADWHDLIALAEADE